MGRSFFEQPVSFSENPASKSEVELTREGIKSLMEDIKEHGRMLREEERKLESEIEEFGGKGTLVRKLEELRRDAEWISATEDDFNNGNIEKVLISRV